MHKVAIASPVTRILLILPASSLTEVCYRRKVHNNRVSSIKSSSEILKRLSSVFFLPELSINITNHVISEIITNVERLKSTVLGEFIEEVLVEVIEVGLDLAGVDGLTLGVDAGGDDVRTLVHVGE